MLPELRLLSEIIIDPVMLFPDSAPYSPIDITGIADTAEINPTTIRKTTKIDFINNFMSIPLY